MVTRLPKLRLSHASGGTAEVYLHGAHVTSWVPAGGSEALFLSRAATFAPGAAIRGGVPVIFPQFAGMGPLPKHGFARTQPWERVDDADRPDAVLLRLRDSAETRTVWPHPFLAELAVQIGGDWLSIALTVHNTGDAAFEFTAALHTYLRVGDVRRATVEGLRGLRYRVTGEPERVDEAREVAVAGPVDRVYLHTPPELRVHDAENARTFVLRSEGFADTVVWNPWTEATAALPDMEDDEYLEMLCVGGGAGGIACPAAGGRALDGRPADADDSTQSLIVSINSAFRLSGHSNAVYAEEESEDADDSFIRVLSFPPRTIFPHPDITAESSNSVDMPLSRGAHAVEVHAVLRRSRDGDYRIRSAIGINSATRLLAALGLWGARGAGCSRRPG